MTPSHSAAPLSSLQPLAILLFISSIIAAVFFAVFTKDAFWPTGQNMLDASGMFAGRDFVNFWTASHIFAQGDTALLFDVAAYNAFVAELFGQTAGEYIWSYPPHIGLLLAPLHYLSYPAALAVFEITTLALFVITVVLAVPHRHRKMASLLACTSPALLPVLLLGQNGFLSGACIVGALCFCHKRPLVAAMFLCVLTFKPQLGVAVCVALLAMGAWRTLALAAVLGMLWLGTAIALYGVAPFLAYLEFTLPHHAVLFRLYAQDLGIISPYGALRIMGVEANIALTAHLAIALLCITLLFSRIRKWSSQKGFVLLLTAIATYLITPYAQGHDMAALCAAIVIAAYTTPALTERIKAHPAALGLVVMLWSLPALGLYFSVNGWPLVAPLVLVAFALLMLFSRQSPRLS